MYNDIVTTVGKDNGSFLVLLDLSAAIDTIDHDNLFYILEKYVGIGGSALPLIRSDFSNRTQRVQIDGIMSDFASLLCGVPQGSVLGPMKFCFHDWLQTTQPTSGGAVTADSSCCANCVEPPRPQQWGPDLPFLAMPAMRTRWMAGAAAHQKRVMSRPIQVRQL